MHTSYYCINGHFYYNVHACTYQRILPELDKLTELRRPESKQKEYVMSIDLYFLLLSTYANLDLMYVESCRIVSNRVETPNVEYYSPHEYRIV